jgi:hypothetical protein
MNAIAATPSPRAARAVFHPADPAERRRGVERRRGGDEGGAGRVRREEGRPVHDGVRQRGGGAPRTPEHDRGDGAVGHGDALGRPEPVARDPGEEPLHLRRVGGGEHHERGAAGLASRPGPVEQRDRGAPARVDAGVGERLAVERVEPELGGEGAPGARDLARAREPRHGRVQRGELLGGAACLGDDHRGADGGRHEPLGRRPPATALAAEDRERREEERSADRAPEHVNSLP